MAISKSFRSFNDGGNIVSFSHIKFREQVKELQDNRKNDGKKQSLDDIYIELAEKIGISSESVKKWYKGDNGPGDIDLIKSLANAMGVDYSNLVAKTESLRKDFNFNISDTSESEIIKGMYRLMIDFIYWFIGTEQDSKAVHYFDNPQEEMHRYILEMYRCLDVESISLSDQNYFNLRKTITELRYIASCYSPIVNIPKDWNEVNQLLQSVDFYESLYCYPTDTLEDIGVEKSIEDPDKLMHMLFEDMPEFDSYALERCDNRCQELSSYRQFPDCAPYEIIAREFAYTLRLIMKKRFPEVFKGDEK